MGMFDKPEYLTGENGFVGPGDTFYIHNARREGTVNVGGDTRDQVKLLVSYEPDGDKKVVFTSGTGIVGQVLRMDETDRNLMANGGLHVRLDQVPSQKGNPTNVLTPASQPPPASALGDEPDF